MYLVLNQSVYMLLTHWKSMYTFDYTCVYPSTCFFMEIIAWHKYYTYLNSVDDSNPIEDISRQFSSLFSQSLTFPLSLQSYRQSRRFTIIDT